MQKKVTNRRQHLPLIATQKKNFQSFIEAHTTEMKKTLSTPINVNLDTNRQQSTSFFAILITSQSVKASTSNFYIHT